MSRSPEFLSAILSSGRPVILDGAMGTELQRRKIDTGLPLWSASVLIKKPEVVKEIHADYLKAGADIITTNTFRTNMRTFLRAGLPDQSRELTLLACSLAKDAKKTTHKDQSLIAGCVATLEDCYRPDLTPDSDILYSEHQLLTQNLADGGVDFIFLETMNSIRETEAALAAAAKTNLPVAISFVCTKEGRLLSGEILEKALEIVMPFRPLFVATNCAPIDVISTSLAELLNHSSFPVGIYANGDGKPDDLQGWIFNTSTGPQNYLNATKEWVKSGAKIIGGCCGTTPEYIEMLSKSFS